jgi:hypothetical protein
MKLTLLEMVQDILSDMDSDLCNSIGDTEESFQVARILKSSFYDIISRKDWVHLRKTLALENSLDTAIPNRLKLPEGISKMEFISYSQKKEDTDNQRFKELQYMYPDEFLLRTNSRVPGNADTVEVVMDDVTMFILNDKPPLFYTSFDDAWIVTDSYVADLSNTLVGSQAQCVAYMAPDWSLTDEFIPDLPTEAFPLLLAEAKSTAFARIKQQIDQKSEQQANRNNIAMAQRGWAVKGGVRYPNYGRQSRKYNSGSHFNPRQYTGGE